MSLTNKAKLAKAIEYLRSRGKYLADQSCKWRPRSAAATDVRLTWEEYKASRLGVAIIRRLGDRK